MASRKRTPPLLLGLSLVVSSIWFWSCGDDSPAKPRTTTATVDSVVVDTTQMSLVRSFSVQLSEPAGIQIDYWTDASSRLRVTDETESAAHQRLAARLLPSSVYHYEVRAVSAGASPGEPVTGTFTTDPLPPELEAVSFSARGHTTSSLTMIELRVTGFNAYVFVDDNGQVVWYWKVDGGTPQGSCRRPNGNFAFKAGQRLLEVSPAGEVVAEGTGAFETVHHDIINTPRNTLLFMTQDAEATVNDTTWVGDEIWEWNPEMGTTQLRWNFWDYYDPVADRAIRSRPDDFSHGNSLAIGPQGNIIVSFNFLNQIISLSPDFQTIEWKLGGIGSDFDLAPEDVFTGQHSASEPSPGRVLLFDNRTESVLVDEWSRALELRIDKQSGSATRVWQFRPMPDNYARIISSARRLDNGNTLVHFGTAGPVGGAHTGGPIETYEVTSGGSVLWKMRIDNANSAYRANPFTDIAGEVVVEDGT